MAGVLDSARMRTFIAKELNVSVENVHAFVLGGHGDTMVPLPRYSTVAGIPITELMAKATIDAICDADRRRRPEITKLVGTSAWYAPGASAVEMVEAILLDKKKILPCSVFLQGEYGVQRPVRRRAVQARRARPREDHRDQADAGRGRRVQEVGGGGEGTGRRHRGLGLDASSASRVEWRAWPTATLVVVHAFDNGQEAELAVGALDAAGIDAMIQADSGGGMRPHLAWAGVGYRDPGARGRRRRGARRSWICRPGPRHERRPDHRLRPHRGSVRPALRRLRLRAACARRWSAFSDSQRRSRSLEVGCGTGHWLARREARQPSATTTARRSTASIPQRRCSQAAARVTASRLR